MDSEPNTPWYVWNGDSIQGPLKREELEALLRDEQVTTNSPAWAPSLNGWTPIREIEELGTVVADIPPPVPDSIQDSDDGDVRARADAAQRSYEARKTAAGGASSGEKSFGSEPPPLPEENSSASTDTDESDEPHPWRRFWARTVDVYLWVFPGGALIGAASASLSPDLYLTLVNDSGNLLWALLAVASWIPVESFLLAWYGTTPGKWLLSMRVASTDNRPLTYNRTLKRSVDVWLRGLGMSIPLVSFITQLVAYSKLKKNEITSWDDTWDMQVLSTDLRGGRVVLTVAVIFGYAMLVSVFTEIGAATG